MPSGCQSVKRYAGEREYAVTEIGIRFTKDRRKHLRRNVKAVLILIRVGGEAIAGGTLAITLVLPSSASTVAVDSPQVTFHAPLPSSSALPPSAVIAALSGIYAVPS